MEQTQQQARQWREMLTSGSYTQDGRPMPTCALGVLYQLSNPQPVVPLTRRQRIKRWMQRKLRPIQRKLRWNYCPNCDDD